MAGVRYSKHCFCQSDGSQSQATLILHWLPNSSERLILLIRVALIDMTTLPPYVKAAEAMLHGTVGGLFNMIQKEKL